MPVQSITDADEAHHVDVKARMVRYGIQMGLRMACFIAAFFTTGWVQVACFLGAIVLPYVAVVLANVGDKAEHQPASYNQRPIGAPALGPAAPAPKALGAEAEVLATSFRTHSERAAKRQEARNSPHGTEYEPTSRSWVVPPTEPTSGQGEHNH